jgi:hypothetical protein
MTIEEFKLLALSLPGTIEAPHFDRIAFKVENKRIYATLHEPSATVNLKLSPIDQSVFCSFDKELVHRVPNKWGLHGWTTFALDGISAEVMHDALSTAYQEIFKSKKGKK